MNERIVIDPKICHGKPVIRGTRMPVALVLGSLAGGMSFEVSSRIWDLEGIGFGLSVGVSALPVSVSVMPSHTWLRPFDPAHPLLF